MLFCFKLGKSAKETHEMLKEIYKMKPSHQRVSMSVLSVSGKCGPAWKTPPRKTKVRSEKSRIMTMLIVFFDSESITHKKFLPESTTLNDVAYTEVLKRLLIRIRRVRPVYTKQGSWTLLHNNARQHTALVVRQFL
ncbi:mariner Mos1 transposase [Trichonephila clavipes]|nr:mariner Mos1 transposase [Trichonephila clavipes]